MAGHRFVVILVVLAVGCGSPMKKVKWPVEVPTTVVRTRDGSIPPGTRVPVLATETLSSRQVAGDDPVTSTQQGFVVAHDVLGEDGAVLIASGTTVTAQVTRKVHRRVGKPGYVMVAFKTTTDVNGALVRLSDAPRKVRGKKRLGGVIAGSILLFPIGLLFLLLQGGDVTVEAGSGYMTEVVQ